MDSELKFSEPVPREDLKVILGCALDLGGKFGVTTLVDVVTGSRNRDVLHHKLNENRYYGKLSRFEQWRMRFVLEALVGAGYIDRTSEDYPKIVVTKKGRRLLQELDGGGVDDTLTVLDLILESKGKLEGRLDELGEDKDEVVQVLKKVLTNKRNAYDKRRHAIWGLGELRSKEGVEALIESVGESDSMDRLIASALGKIGDEAAVPCLIKLLDSRAPQTVSYAAKALGRIGDPRALKPLETKLDHKKYYVRKSSEVALRRIKKRV